MKNPIISDDDSGLPATDASALHVLNLRSYQTLMDNVPGITFRCSVDDHRTMHFISQNVSHITGYSAVDFLGNGTRSFQSIIHPNDHDRVKHTIDQALARHTSWSVDYQFLHRDGSTRWLREHGSFLLNDDKSPPLINGFAIDITQEKQLTNQSQRHINALIALNNIASNTNLDFKEQMQSALRLGTQFLDLEIGILSRIEGDSYHVRQCVAPEHSPITNNQVLDLGSTYCVLTLANEGVLSINQMASSSFCNHPCYNLFQLETYIGMTLIVDSDLYGTLNFSSKTCRNEPLNQSDSMFVSILGQWISTSILRQRSLKELHLNEQRLRNLYELSPVGIALNAYENGSFIDANPALQALTGYSLRELYRLDYWQLTPPEYKEQEQFQMQCLQQDGRYGPYEKEYICKNGNRCHVLLNGILTTDSNGTKVIWSIIEDINDRKRTENMKSEFISTVSHELRTPLTSISGALGLLTAGVAGVLPASATKMLNIAHSNSLRLGLLINDLLDMDKLIAGKMQFDLQQHSLNALLVEAIQSIQPYASQYNVTLILDMPLVDADVTLFVDKHRFAQIMANLLSNASKFSHDGGVVEIAVCSKRPEQKIRINVVDHGIGISYEFRDRIFSKFSQADASDTRNKEGTGLGLSICREMTERMGGTIGFESKENEGSTFWVEFSGGL